MAITLLYQKIVGDIIKLINKGKLPQNSQIPSITEIIKKYKVSHITALRAFNELASKGYIFKLEGRGYFVKKVNKSSKRNKLLNTIACIIRPIRPVDLYDNYFHEITFGMESECTRNKFNIFLPHCIEVMINKDLSRNMNALNSIKYSIAELEDKVDGYILDEGIPDSLIAEVIKNTKPMVLVNRASDVNIDSVSPDNIDGATQSVNMALNLKYTHFAIYYHPDSRNHAERFDGYIKTLDAHGIPEKNILIKEADREKTLVIDEMLEYRKKIKAKNSRNRLAVLSTSDSFARDVCDRAAVLKIRVPEELGIVTFCAKKYSYYKEPIITSMKIDPLAIGEKTVQILIEKMHENITHPENYRVPMTVLMGKTL
ncbi:MAG: LacI family DNA-binding transcriptional regulator [bacterium]